MEDQNLESTYVKDVYNKIANHFDKTRTSYWNLVDKFIQTIKINSICLDLGCGNGKYLGVRDDITFFALDNSEKLLQIVNSKYPNITTTLADVTSTPYDNNSFDYIISIAVIHHLSTEGKRIQMIREIERLLKFGGKCLITGWANKEGAIKQLNKSIRLPNINNNLNNNMNDYLIPWENRDDKITYYRFYHLFEEGELENLVNQVSNLKIISSVFDKNNWNIIIEKI